MAKTTQRGLAALPFALVLACVTSPLGRTQLRIFPETQMAEMGVAAYDKLKTETPRSRDLRAIGTVRCVADALTAELSGPAARIDWEVTVFADPAANAFALPGGKIGVFTGLLSVARSQDQLATVMGHEVSHVVAGHANERVSTAYATQTGLDYIATLSGKSSPAQKQLIAILGAGAQFGIVLPFSRAQEREADLLGLDLMAKAGFDPEQSIQLWRNMAQAGGAQPPEFLSTHPSHHTRIDELASRMPHARALQDQARAQGKRPNCS
ncbi:MAG: M48 family metallopeptidase [Myxococcota bacterium]